MNFKKRKRICIVSTVPYVLRWFMRPHIQSLSNNYDVILVTNGTENDLSDMLNENVSFVPLKIERKISLFNDVLALIKLWFIFRRKKIDCVHSIMPKSGLISMIAGKMAFVPYRFHTFTGQIWVNKSMVKRFIFKTLDKLLVYCSTHVLADSYTQRLFLIENNVVLLPKISVLAEGSVAGVDTKRFSYNKLKRNKIREDLQIPHDAIVFLFLGRLTYDKGLLDLENAFTIAATENKNIHLLIVGPDEDELEQKFIELEIKFPNRVHIAGFTEHSEEYMSASNVICLPSYREGFGSVIIEAAAIGIPAIASRIYGITDAIEDGVTGILHEPKNAAVISIEMIKLATNDKFRDAMGLAAKKRAIEHYSEDKVASAFIKFYRNQLT